MKLVQFQSVLKGVARVVLVVLATLPGISEIQAQGRLILNGGKINITNGAALVIGNSNPNAITRVSGHIISEGENNRIRWNIGTATGSFSLPWGKGSATYFPVSFSLSAASGNGTMYFSTLPTAAQNSLTLPTGITHFNGAQGEDISLVAVDRFWKIDPQGYTTKPTFSNLVFTYLDAEFATPNKTSVENKLTALRWNNNISSWTDYNTGGSVNTVSNTVTIVSISGTNLNSWWSMGYPGSSFHWVASSNSTWNSSSNWSLTAGGSGGAGIPSSGDVVYFDDVRDGSCTIDTNLDVSTIQVATGYSGSILQGASTMTIAHDANFSDGAFQGGNATMTVAGNLNLTGASFTSTSGVLDVKNNFNLTSSTFSHNNGTVRFSGTSGTQTIKAESVLKFNNLDITNSATTPGVIFETNAQLQGVMSLGTNVTVDPDGATNNRTFTLLSTGDNPTKDAAIGILPSGAKINGNVTVQRYMAIEGLSGGRIYRYISSPVKLATVADIQNEIQVTGTFTGRSVCSGCATNQSMFAYDESIITDNTGDGINNQNDGYINFPKLTNTETLESGRGYAIYVRGNIISSALWDVKGLINAGNTTPVSFPVSYTSSGVAINDGWNLVGNPFPSTIDWNASAGWTKTNLANSIYVRDNGGTAGQYATWNGVVGTNGGARYIPTGQAFWVQGTGGVPSLLATENVKTPGIQTIFFREQAPAKVLRLTLKQGTVSDEAIIHFRDDATENFDAQADALKLPNATFNLSTQLMGKDKMAINSLSSVPCDNHFLIAVDNVSKGDYALSFSNLETFPTSTTIILTDGFTGKTIDVSVLNDYSFTVTSEPLSFSNNRFSLSVSWPAVETDFTVTSNPVCEGTDATVVISNVHDSYTYTAWTDDVELSVSSKSAANITFSVPKENIQIGQSPITIRATPSGCGIPFEKTEVLEVKEIPSLSSVTGASACREGAVTLKASGGKSENKYRWYDSESSTPVKESADSTFTTPVLKNSKTYYVALANGLGCEGERLPVVANVVQYADPTIIVQNDSLKTNYNSGLQWYRDGVELSGELTGMIYPDSSGNYSVTIQVQGCTASTDYIYIVENVIDNEKEIILDIYPNPVVNELTLTTSVEIGNIHEASIFNDLGQRVGSFVLNQVNNKTSGIYNMRGKPSGLYIIKVVTQDQTREVKIIKE